MAPDNHGLNRFLLPIALAFPILVLGGIVLIHSLVYARGFDYEFPITGYDPRDILSGHYVVYRIRFPEEVCPDFSRQVEPYDTCFCLTGTGPEPEGQPVECDSLPRNDCFTWIPGTCEHGRFRTNLEKFFVPESRAQELDRIVRDGHASIRITVDRQGHALVKDLLVPQTMPTP